MSKVLFVMTGASYWTLADGTRHPTGYWAEKFAAPTANSPAMATRSWLPPPAASFRTWMS